MTLMALTALMGAYASSLSSAHFRCSLHFRCSFTAILPISLLFYSYSALLLCCLACSAAFVDFYCLSGLVLPLSICCLACSAAFVYFYCLYGHGRLCLLRCLCRLLLPFWAFTAFVDLLPGLLRCLCQLLLPCWALLTLSTFAAFVGLHRLCLIFLSLSAIADFVNFCCLCRLALPVSDFVVVVGYADFAYWMSQLAYLINYSALQLALRVPTNSVPV